MSVDVKHYWIEGFVPDSFPAEFTGAYVFKGNNRNFLLNKQGYSILLDDELLKDVEDHNIGEELAVLLIQHRFLLLDDNENAAEKNSRDDIHPVFFMIDLTNRCNMACKYCLREAEMSENSKTLSDEKAVEIISRQICGRNGGMKSASPPPDDEVVESGVDFVMKSVDHNAARAYRLVHQAATLS